MKENLKSAYVFVKTWRGLSWAFLTLSTIAAVGLMLTEMSISAYRYVGAWGAYRTAVKERDLRHADAVQQQIQATQLTLKAFVESYRFSLGEIKKANPTAQLPASCPLFMPRIAEGGDEDRHCYLHALSIVSPAIEAQMNTGLGNSGRVPQLADAAQERRSFFIHPQVELALVGVTGDVFQMHKEGIHKFLYSSAADEKLTANAGSENEVSLALKSGSILSELKRQIDSDKEQMYAAVYSNLDAMKKPLEAEIDRVEGEIEKKRMQQEDLQQQIEAIRHPLVHKEMVQEIAQSAIYLPEKSVYTSREKYPALHQYGIVLPMVSTFPKESTVLKREQLKAWKESIARLAVWLPAVISREPIKKVEVSEYKDMNHVLSEDESDRVKTLRGRIKQIDTEISNLQEMIAPHKTQFLTLIKLGNQLRQEQSMVLAGWQVDKHYQELEVCRKMAEEEGESYIIDMVLYEEALKDVYANETVRALTWILWIVAVLGMAWLLWGLLLVMADFMVCPLVCALRAQGLSSAFTQKKD